MWARCRRHYWHCITAKRLILITAIGAIDFTIALASTWYACAVSTTKCVRRARRCCAIFNNFIGAIRAVHATIAHGINRYTLSIVALEPVFRARSMQLIRLLCRALHRPFVAIIGAILFTHYTKTISLSVHCTERTMFFDQFSLTLTPLHSAVWPTHAPYAHRNEYRGQSVVIHAVAVSSLPSAQLITPSHISDDLTQSPLVHCLKFLPQFWAMTPVEVNRIRKKRCE